MVNFIGKNIIFEAEYQIFPNFCQNLINADPIHLNVAKVGLKFCSGDEPDKKISKHTYMDW